MGLFFFFFLLLVVLVTTLPTSHAQETPAFHVPMWDTSGETHRQSFCHQHAAVEQGKLPLRHALEGLELSVGFSRFQLNNENTTIIDPVIPDIGIDFLDELAKRAGFSFRQSYGILESPTDNKTWSDVVDFGTSVYDLVGDYMLETTERLNRKIIYPDGWYDANYIMVMKTGADGPGVDLFAIVAPFSNGLWGLIALTTLLSGLIYYVIDYFDSRVRGRPMDFGLETSLFNTAFLFDGHFQHQPKSRATRILVFSMSFLFLIMIACYTANLASLLVLQNPPLVINDIQDAIRYDLVFCVDRNSPYDIYLRQEYGLQPKNLVRTWTGNMEADSSAFLALQEGQCDLVFTTKGSFDKFQRSQQHNPNCNLAFVGRIQKFVSSGFALKDSEHYCSSLLRDVLHLHMLELKDSGMYDLIWENYLRKFRTNSCDTNSGANEMSQYEALRIDDFSGIFAMHAIAVLLSIIITLINFYKQPTQRRESMVRELQSGTSLNRAVKYAAASGQRFSFGFSSSSQRSHSMSQSNNTNNARLPSPLVEDSSQLMMTTTTQSTQFHEIQENTLAATNNNDMAEEKTIMTTSEEKEEEEEEKTMDYEEEDDLQQEEFVALMEQTEQQTMLIEALLKHIQTLDERNQEMDLKIQTMENKFKTI